MKILYATSEMVPYVKTGGLADVAGALPRALASLGHDVAVVMPYYGAIDPAMVEPEPVLPEVVVDLPAGLRVMSVWKSELPAATAHHSKTEPKPVSVYLIRDKGLFDRPGLYGAEGKDYPDNALRFGYFCQAAIWMIKGLNWHPDLINCNDWQTALIPIFLRTLDANRTDPLLERIRVMFTIHNISYQGSFSPHTLGQLGLPEVLYNPEAMEYFGQVNLMKGGLVFSDWVTAVSRQYSREIQTPEFGFGMQGVLRKRADSLSGILNGIDPEIWNPKTDPALAENYSAKKLKGKATCKKALQKRFGLDPKAKGPLLGIISRLADQKGFDILAHALPEILATGAQFVLLGTGHPGHHKFFEHLAEKHVGQVGVELSFNDALAHQIEAGADMFLMPSHFEPCGLNQLYSLRYGTVPVVRRTGGLADSIKNLTPKGLASGRSNGFVFTKYHARDLEKATLKAIRFYRKDPKGWQRLMRNGMAQDFSWEHSAKVYEKLMEAIVSQPGEGED